MNLGSKVLPNLPLDPLLWINRARPIVDGKPRDFLIAPMWLDIYRDRHSFKMVVAGRQVYKSTYCTDILACEATTRRGIQVNYTTHSGSSLNTFSTQRMRVGTFMQNPTIGLFPRHGVGNIGEISLLNNSTIYMTTDHNQYKNIEGKSISLNMLDEAQYQQIEFMNRVRETMTATKGRLEVLGIGGELGGPYHNVWESTDQREWIYEDPYWRDKLEFDMDGLVIGEYLVDVLKGHWTAEKPDNYMKHGYHIPQTIMPSIPLTESDAISLYRVDPSFSIEWKRKNYPDAVFRTHVMGMFHKAEKRPVTPDMVKACMLPYRYQRLLTLDEIAELKETYMNEIRVAMGIDWGSGPTASHTVMSILIHWKKSKRIQLAYIDKRPAEHQMDQTKRFVDAFTQAKVDFGIADLGYGAIQVKAMQDGGSDSQGNWFDGLGSSKLKGSRTVGKEHQALAKQEVKVDEHGEETARFTLDKSTAIQGFIDMLGTYVSHPILLDKKYSRPKFMIPFDVNHEYETDWLVQDFCDITRQDLVDMDEEGEATEDRRKFARKEFNHPKDSTMSIIYAKTALESESEWNWVSA